MKTTPIREIIFSISFKETLEMNQLDHFASSNYIQQEFAEIIPGFNTNISPNKQGTPPKTDITRAGYIFKSVEPYNRILHVRLGSLSYHNIHEYVSYNTLIKELDKYWKLLQECSQALTVSSVGVRYINFVEFEGNETRKDLVTIKVTHPFTELDFELNQIKLELDPRSQTEGNIVVTNAIDDAKQGVVIDISINRKFKGAQFNDIEDAFRDMQTFKNDIFNKSITEKTRNKYELLSN